MTTVKSIKIYENCDVYVMGNDVQQLGFAKETTFGEMIDKATENNCAIITKNGGGKWYLKGQGKDYTETLLKIEENAGKFPRIKVWLIEY